MSRRHVRLGHVKEARVTGSSFVQPVGGPGDVTGRRIATHSSWARDVVGIGALNLDYIVDIARSGPADDEPEGHLTERLAALFASRSPGFEWGTELSADEQTVHAALEQINTASVDVALGGSAFNAILALARMELDVRLGYVGIAGRMPLLGFSSRQAVAEWGIDDSMVRYDESRLSGVCLSVLDGDERTLCTHAGANAGMADYLRSHRDELVAYLAGSRLLHVTSLLDDQGPAELLMLLQAVREVNPAVTISLDPGHVWATNVSPAIAGTIATSDYLLLNNKEFLALGSGTLGDTDEEIAARILQAYGERLQVIIVKRSHGIANFRSDGTKVTSSTVTPPQTPLASHEIEDSTGAGDVFAAGVLAALASQRLHIELGSVLGMALARHKLRYVGTLGHSGFARITREILKPSGDGASQHSDTSDVDGPARQHWRQSIVPEDARLVPDHWLCRLRRHQGLRWSYDIEALHPGTRTRIVFAQCTDCGRDQSRVRVVHRPSHTFDVTPPASGDESWDAGSSLEDSAGR